MEINKIIVQASSDPLHSVIPITIYINEVASKQIFRPILLAGLAREYKHSISKTNKLAMA